MNLAIASSGLTSQTDVMYAARPDGPINRYLPTDSPSEYPFSGRFQKFDSVLASFAAAVFKRNLADRLPEKALQMPCFDCRTFVVPTLTEACNTVLWRQRDAVKNAISMAAQSMFSHKRLQHKSGPQMQEMMHTEKGVNFNDFPAPFKRGMFARRVKSLRVLSEQELSKIPEKHRLTGPVERSSIELVDIWLAKHVDPVRVLFLGDPIVAVRAVEKGRSPEETSVASV